MELSLSLPLILAAVFGGLALFAFSVATRLRRVVPSNEVHIIQSSKKTVSYGAGADNQGNSYYEWPASLPVLGVTKTILPISVFALDLVAYEAYDKGRLPFIVDVKAFFRITDSNLAAARVASFQELHNQLSAIVQGAVRTILASSEIEEIMAGRSKFGKAFTDEVDGQLASWGVATVKSIELMDIRDHKDSKVIQNIMEKKKSHIEMESRTAVAMNNKLAEIAEIESKREVDLQAQEAEQQVGLRTVETKQQVALSNEASSQRVKEQQRTTKEKEMAVLKIESVSKAEIEKEVQLVKADQNRATTILMAEGTKQVATLEAEGKLEAKKREAEGISLEGQARAAAERAMLLAPVEAQTTLAKEIGENKSYQQYLITIKQVEANQAVGIAQADALKAAQIKVIANSGSASSGMESVLDVLSSKGGTQIGAMLEGMANTDAGQALLSKILPKEDKAPTKSPVNGRA